MALVFTRFGWTPLAPGIFPMMMSCTGLSIHNTLVLPLKYGVSSSTMAVGYRLTIPSINIHNSYDPVICSGLTSDFLTQPFIPPGSINRVPASAGVRAGMSPLSGGR